MKFHAPTKIIFFILAVLLILAGAIILYQYQKLKSQPAALMPAQVQPAGTCAPDLSACAGNAALCMDQNKAPVCN